MSHRFFSASQREPRNRRSVRAALINCSHCHKACLSFSSPALSVGFFFDLPGDPALGSMRGAGAGVRETVRETLADCGCRTASLSSDIHRHRPPPEQSGAGQAIPAVCGNATAGRPAPRESRVYRKWRRSEIRRPRLSPTCLVPINSILGSSDLQAPGPWSKSPGMSQFPAERAAGC